MSSHDAEAELGSWGKRESRWGHRQQSFKNAYRTDIRTCAKEEVEIGQPRELLTSSSAGGQLAPSFFPHQLCREAYLGVGELMMTNLMNTVWSLGDHRVGKSQSEVAN